MPKKITSQPEATKPGFRPIALGDIMKANKGAPYVITKEGWQGEVTRIWLEGQHPQKCDIQVDGFDVHSSHFTLVKKGTGVVKQKKLLVVSMNHEGKYDFGEFYKMSDVEWSLKYKIDVGEGIKPHSIRVFEAKDIEIDPKFGFDLNAK